MSDTGMTIEQRDFATSELGLIVRTFGIGGVSHAEAQSRNGEAEAVATAVGRETVPQGGSGRILANKPSARPAPKTPAAQAADTIARVAVDGDGPILYTHRRSRRRNGKRDGRGDTPRPISTTPNGATTKQGGKMPKTKKEERKDAKVAVLVRVDKADLEYMKGETLGATNAAAVDIYIRKHINAERDEVSGR